MANKHTRNDSASLGISNKYWNNNEIPFLIKQIGQINSKPLIILNLRQGLGNWDYSNNVGQNINWNKKQAFFFFFFKGIVELLELLQVSVPGIDCIYTRI